MCRNDNLSNIRIRYNRVVNQLRRLEYGEEKKERNLDSNITRIGERPRGRRKGESRIGSSNIHHL